MLSLCFYSPYSCFCNVPPLLSLTKAQTGLAWTTEFVKWTINIKLSTVCIILNRQGMVVYAEPPEACSPIAKPPNDTDYDGKWIALISRYNCTFETKIRMAQDAGYDTAIVHNVNSNDLGNISEHVRYITKLRDSSSKIYSILNLEFYRTNVRPASNWHQHTVCVCWPGHGIPPQRQLPVLSRVLCYD